MKKLIVEQVGYVQIEVERTFVIEVPDGVSECDAERALDGDDTPSDADDIEWTDDSGQGWLGFSVESIETQVYDPDEVLGAPRPEGLKAVRLDLPPSTEAE